MTAPGGLRERKKARTREALRDAAMELFSRQGFDHTTVEEIAEACEVSPRTFFRYFPTKEDVLFADSDARRDALLSVLAAQPLERTPLAALHAAIRALALDYRDDRAALETRSRIVAASPQLQAYKAEHQHGWEAAVVDELLRRARAVGSPVTPAELRLLAAVAIASIRVSLDSWVAGDEGLGPEVFVDAAFGRIASGFGPTG